MIITIDTTNKIITISGEIEIEVLKRLEKDYPDYRMETSQSVVYWGEPRPIDTNKYWWQPPYWTTGGTEYI